jgi:hypothetical protein
MAFLHHKCTLIAPNDYFRPITGTVGVICAQVVKAIEAIARGEGGSESLER